MHLVAVSARAGKLGDRLAQEQINAELNKKTKYESSSGTRRCAALRGLLSTVTNLVKHPRSTLTTHEKELEYLNERLAKLLDDPATELNWLDFAGTQATEVVIPNIRSGDAWACRV